MQTQSLLQRVPLEILFAVLGCLSQDELLPLRLVSQVFLHLVTPLAISKIAIAINALDESRFHRDLWLIKSLATTSSVISSSVRTLYIKSLLCPRFRRIVNSDGNYAYLLLDNKPGPGEEIAKAVLSEYLAPFLSKFQNLEALVYELPSVSACSSC
jgi:hypothetical protein